MRDDYTTRLQRQKEARQQIQKEQAGLERFAAVEAAQTKKARKETISGGATDDIITTNLDKSDHPLFNCLPHVLAIVGGYALEGTHLRETSRAAYEGIAAAYKVDMMAAARHFMLSEKKANFGFQPKGELGEIKTVKHITITNARPTHREAHGGYRLAETAVRKLVTHAVSTLASLTVKGESRRDNKKVAVIIGMLTNSSPTDQRVASRLTKIEVTHSSESVSKIGWAAVANRLPVLQALSVARCHANESHMKNLIQAIGKGHVGSLREVNWDALAGGETAVTNLMLEALSRGKCPEIEFLSFINNRGFDQASLSNLTKGLKACPKLREVRMDTNMAPQEQLQALVKMLEEGDMPRLKRLEIRIPREVSVDLEEDVKDKMEELKRAASSRSEFGSPVNLVMWFGEATLNSW